MKFLMGFKKKPRLLKFKSSQMSWISKKIKNYHLSYLVPKDFSLDNYYEDNDYCIMFLGQPVYSKYYHFNSNQFIKDILLNLKDLNNFFKRLEGIFSIFIVHKNENKSIVITDKLGLYPVYMWKFQNGMMVANDLDQIIIQEKFKLNYNSIAEFFKYGFNISQGTFVENVFRLDAGSVYYLEGETLEKRPYFSFNAFLKDKGEGNLNELFALIEDSIKHAATTKEDCYTHLSGGLDTRTILATLLKNKIKFTAFTYYDHEGDEDLFIASHLSDKYQFKIVKEKEENDCSPLSFYELDFLDCNLLRDSSLRGLNFKEEFSRSFMAGKFGSEIFAKMVNDNIINHEHFKEQDYFKFDSGQKENLKEQLKQVDIDKSFLPSYTLITKAMRSYIFAYKGKEWARPARYFDGVDLYPFLNSEIIKLVWSLSPNYFQKGEIYTKILNKIFPELTEINWSKSAHRINFDNKILEPAQDEKTKKEIIYNKRLKYCLNKIRNVPFYKNLEKLKQDRPLNLIYFDYWYKAFKDHIILDETYNHSLK